MKLENMIKHFKLICIHKYYVFKNCKQAGLIWRGIKHDLSKFSPTEFFESVKYFDGSRSPIDVCKEKNGVSKAWLHHKGRNTHHYEYWQDNFDNGGNALLMPYEDALELVCDYLGAGMAYMKDKFTYKGELEWWMAKAKKPLAMHPAIKMFVTSMLFYFAADGNNKALVPAISYPLYKYCIAYSKKEK